VRRAWAHRKTLTGGAEAAAQPLSASPRVGSAQQAVTAALRTESFRLGCRSSLSSIPPRTKSPRPWRLWTHGDRPRRGSRGAYAKLGRVIDKNEAWLKAIEVMTAWTDEQDSTDFVSGRIGQHTAGADDGLELTAGLVNLAGALLSNLAKERGNGTPEGEREILQEFARRVERRRQR
jgi:hypothetical protein